MKTVMKKIFSLMLVAVLLVSAVPFAASAGGFDAISIKVFQEVDGSDAPVVTSSYTPSAENATRAEVLSSLDLTDSDIVGVWFDGAGGKINAGDTIPAGSAIKVRKNPVTTPAPAPQPEPQPQPQPEPQPTPVSPIKIVVKIDSSNNVVWEGTKVPANGEYALVENLLTYCWNKSWDDVYTFSHAYRYANDGSKGEVAGDAQIFAGEEVHIMVKSVPTNSGPNNSGSNNGGVNDFYGDEAMKDIWLYIYVNKNMTEPAKRVLLNNYTIISDGVIDKDQVISVVDDYYKATNSNNGIIWKGMYKSYASNVATNLQFVSGQLYNSLSGLNEDRYNDVVVIMARVDGVAAINSYTADSSNPKTGDMIMAPVAVLGLSASALAVLFFLNKKRAF